MVHNVFQERLRSIGYYNRKYQKEKKVTYARTMVDICPEKEDLNRVRVNADSHRLKYYGETSSENSIL